MKTYKQLPIPEDSAWSRNTLYGKLHWRIRYFLEGVKNIIRWERVREEHYSLECMDYWHDTISFEDVPENKKLKEINIETSTERFDEYLNKYPSSVRAIIKEHGGQDDKKRLCLMVSYYNHNKANKLLFRVLEERLSQWWD